VVQHSLIAGNEGRVDGDRVQLGLTDLAQQFDRVVSHTLPQLGVDIAKDGLGFVVPTPPQVVGQLRQPVQRFGNTRKDRQAT